MKTRFGSRPNPIEPLIYDLHQVILENYMKVVLLIFAAISLASGFYFYDQAESAIHQILAFNAFLMFAVFLCGGAILDAIEKISIKQFSEMPKAAVATEKVEEETPPKKEIPAFNCPFCDNVMREYGRCGHCGNTVDKLVLETEKKKG